MAADKPEPTYDDPEVNFLLGELERIAARRTELAVEDEALLERRLAIFRKLRGMEPPVFCWVMGKRSGIDEGGVLAALRKADERDRAAAGK